MKRFFDFTIALILLIILLPVTVVVAFLIRIYLGSPVFFIQKRPGLNGKPFNMIKFKTMKTVFDAQGNPLPDQLRLTKVGKFLRSTSLDELPELINVLKGEMSLVGPRPLLMEYLPLYDSQQFRRHEVLPGITGWAQINGRNTVAWPDRFKLDVWYVDHQSFFLDIKILFLTVIKVFRREGIAEKNNVTMSKFTGNAQ